MNDAKLEQLIKPIIKIYDDMQLELIIDIAMRLNTYTGVEGSLKWYLDKLQEIGGFNKENLKILSKYSKKSAIEIKRILNDVGYDTTGLDKYKKYYDDGLLKTNPTLIYESIAIKNIIDNAVKETNSIMETIQTKALESSKQSYMKILTDSYIKVSSGVYSYDLVIKDALNKLAKDGFSTATYKNGKTLSLESTVRRDVLTKVHQLAGSIELENANQLDTNLVYVTQHLGARTRTKYTKEDYEVHADWQGKVYMLEGSNDKHSNFYEETGYGEMLGLCGVNCRHHFYPTFEWETHPERIDSIENEKVYKLSQKQRAYERKLREFKRQQEVARLLDDKVRLKKLNTKKKIFNQEYNQFIEENNLQRDYNREYVDKDLVRNSINLENNWYDRLTYQEQVDIKEYISSGSYKINEALYNNRELTDEQIRFRDSLDNALSKAPKFKGIVNRSVYVENIEQRDKILSIFDNENLTGSWNSYVSSSKSIYDDTMKMQMTIKSKNGRDLSKLNDEGGGEIVFPRKTKFKLIDYKFKNGKINIDLEEVE